MSKLKLMFTAAALCGGLLSTAASAMPIAPVQADTAAKVEQVRWVCGPYGPACPVIRRDRFGRCGQLG